MNRVKKHINPITKLADAAFQQATAKVFQRAADAGTPVLVWENGEIAVLKPKDTQPARKKAKNLPANKGSEKTSKR